MNPEFNRFDFFAKSEMTLLVLKFRNESEKFKKKVMALSRQERDNFLYKFYHAFILHEGKENQEELITKDLTRINY
ncbi:MAG TPA: hypothetical protein VIJ95_11490 [Hanamia sp.]